MKKVCLVVVICLFLGMLVASCGSSRPCPAYRSVSPVTASVDLPASDIQQSI